MEKDEIEGAVTKIRQHNDNKPTMKQYAIIFLSSILVAEMIVFLLIRDDFPVSIATIIVGLVVITKLIDKMRDNSRNEIIINVSFFVFLAFLIVVLYEYNRAISVW